MFLFMIGNALGTGSEDKYLELEKLLIIIIIQIQATASSDR